MNFEKAEVIGGVAETIQGTCLTSECNKKCNGASGSAIATVTNKNC